MTVSTLAKCLFLLVYLSLTACQIPYLASGAVEQIRILSSRKKIDKVIDSVAKEEREKLLYSQKALDFAVRKGLKCKDNFQTYVQLDRPYVSYLIVASKKNEIKAKTWWFPIVGSFPYKGFFSEEGARKARKNLNSKNYDTYMRGVSAYSSLGWFDEPLLSSMMSYSKNSLAETIFHECFHSTFYIKSRSDLNEQTAVFFAHYFLLEFLKEQSLDVKKALTSWEEEKLFTRFLEKTIKFAQSFYIKNGKREELFEQIKKDYLEELKPQTSVNNYDSVFLENLNNAKLAAFNTYFYNFDFLEERLNSDFKGSIFDFLEGLKSLKKKEALKLLVKEVK